jgi:hypothetical protein
MMTLSYAELAPAPAIATHVLTHWRFEADLPTSVIQEVRSVGSGRRNRYSTRPSGRAVDLEVPRVQPDLKGAGGRLDRGLLDGPLIGDALHRRGVRLGPRRKWGTSGKLVRDLRTALRGR